MLSARRPPDSLVRRNLLVLFLMAPTAAPGRADAAKVASGDGADMIQKVELGQVRRAFATKYGIGYSKGNSECRALPVVSVFRIPYSK